MKNLILILFLSLIINSTWCDTRCNLLLSDPQKLSSYEQLSKNYNSSDKLMEIVWKNKTNSSSLRMEIEVALKNLEYKIIGQVEDGISDSRLVEFNNKMRAILKPHTDDPSCNANYEVAAYLIDRLFHFDLVPVTVKRKIITDSKTQEISLQYLLRTGDIKLAKKLNQAIEDHKLITRFTDSQKYQFSKRWVLIKILDYLIQNYDRTLTHNIVYQSNLMPAAIDHGLAFETPLTEIDLNQNPHAAKWNDLLKKLSEKDLKQLHYNLQNVSLSDLSQELSQLLDQKIILQINQRQKSLIKFISK